MSLTLRLFAVSSKMRGYATAGISFVTVVIKALSFVVTLPRTRSLLKIYIKLIKTISLLRNSNTRTFLLQEVHPQSNSLSPSLKVCTDGRAYDVH